jgi:cell division protein FtsL
MWIATNPLHVLIIILVIIAASAMAMERHTRSKMLLERERILQEKQAAWDSREAVLRKKFSEELAPVLAERNELRSRLEAITKRRGKFVKPQTNEEIVSRFRELGY